MTEALPRRDTLAIVAAFKIDPSRRELYVEGQRDRLFIKWLTDGSRSRDARIVEARLIDSPQVRGGERGRLMAFANSIGGHDLAIRILVDADFDRVQGIGAPSNVYLTDLRDLESYFLCDECFEKLIMLGLAQDVPTGAEILRQIVREGRRLGLLRLLSLRMELELPFQALDLGKYAAWKKGALTVDHEGVLRSLMQHAGVSRKEEPSLQRAHVALSEELREIDDLQLVHGKDAAAFVRVVCQERNLTPEQAARMLWTSLERDSLNRYEQLSRVAGFLRGDIPIP